MVAKSRCEFEEGERDSTSGREGGRAAESKDFEVHFGREGGESSGSSSESGSRHSED